MSSIAPRPVVTTIAAPIISSDTLADEASEVKVSAAPTVTSVAATTARPPP
jgi:hypothetical protein